MRLRITDKTVPARKHHAIRNMGDTLTLELVERGWLGKKPIVPIGHGV
jgi:hypothetical protein